MVLIAALLLVGACSSDRNETATSTIAPEFDDRDPLIERAGRICEDYAERRFDPSLDVTSTLSSPDTAGQITRIAHELTGGPLAPWDSLPADHFVAHCSFSSSTIAGTSTAICPNGDTVVNGVVRSVFVDADGTESGDYPVGGSLAGHPC